MDLNKRYKSRGTRRLVRFLGFYSVLAFFLLFYSTFARYATIAEDAPTINTANWQVKINDNIIADGQTLTNTITLVPDITTQTTTDDKLAPGKSGYFDIVINPDGTDVAIQYMVSFDTANLPQGITLTRYEIIEDSISETLVSNSIEGEINLQQMSELSSTDTKTIKVYWEWDETSTDIPTGEENYKILATITVQQKIS